MSNYGVSLAVGKYRNRPAYFVCWTTSHHLATATRRAQIRVQIGLGWKTVLVNEGNFNFNDRIKENV